MNLEILAPLKSKEIKPPSTFGNLLRSIKGSVYKYLLIYLHNFKIHKNSGITNEEQES